MSESQEPQHPGLILLEQVMAPLGVSLQKLARDVDVPVGRVSDLVTGKRPVTADMALRLAKYFGTSAELWLRLQAEHDLHVARTTTWSRIEPRVQTYEPGVPDGTDDVALGSDGGAAPEHPLDRAAPAERDAPSSGEQHDDAAGAPDHGGRHGVADTAAQAPLGWRFEPDAAAPQPALDPAAEPEPPPAREPRFIAGAEAGASPEPAEEDVFVLTDEVVDWAIDQRASSARDGDPLTLPASSVVDDAPAANGGAISPFPQRRDGTAEPTPAILRPATRLTTEGFLPRRAVKRDPPADEPPGGLDIPDPDDLRRIGRHD